MRGRMSNGMVSCLRACLCRARHGRRAGGSTHRQIPAETLGGRMKGQEVASPRGHRAVVILATGEVAELADRYRKRCDPEWFERVPPHVSLLAPFELDAPDEEVARRIERAVAGVPPFFLRLAEPRVFVAPGLVLFLPGENELPVRALQRYAERAAPAGRLAFPFDPHLTIGRFACQEAIAPVLAELKEELASRPRDAEPLGFRVEEVHLFGEDPGTGVYTSKARAELSGETLPPTFGAPPSA